MSLPPIHTLNLLPSSCAQRKGGSSYDDYERPCPLNVPQRSWSSTSRAPSPTPSDASSRTSSSSRSSPVSTKLTLIPSSFADADAIVVIPPPGTPHVPGTRPGQGLLLTGPALERLRHPQRQIAKGTRLHPYRFADRRASSVLSLCTS
ncbi:hypothetical protein C8R47DRAFT_1218143 [Mycena vitilis]|nr:hypothetical protein C8R47DRAFT_1218143 [Mycena vitilis]